MQSNVTRLPPLLVFTFSEASLWNHMLGIHCQYSLGYETTVTAKLILKMVWATTLGYLHSCVSLVLTGTHSCLRSLILSGFSQKTPWKAASRAPAFKENTRQRQQVHVPDAADVLLSLMALNLSDSISSFGRTQLITAASSVKTLSLIPSEKDRI